MKFKFLLPASLKWLPKPGDIKVAYKHSQLSDILSGPEACCSCPEGARV